MSDPLSADKPPNGNGPKPAPVPDDDGGAGGDGATIGLTMMHQFTDLLAGWEEQILDLAEQGVDPSPLLRELARSLRAVADQFDAATRPQD
jgi:hypothetical protein